MQTGVKLSVWHLLCEWCRTDRSAGRRVDVVTSAPKSSDAGTRCRGCFRFNQERNLVRLGSTACVDGKARPKVRAQVYLA